MSGRLVVEWSVVAVSIAATLAGLAGGGAEPARAQGAPGFCPYVDARGAIRLPSGFREQWRHSPPSEPILLL